jgi:high-affinity nickel permease
MEHKPTSPVLAALEQLRAALSQCSEKDRRSMAVVAVGFTLGLALDAAVDVATLASSLNHVTAHRRRR